MHILKQSEGIDIIVNSIINNKIVPIIGAGFSAGCRAQNGCVPNGPQLEELMKKLAKEHSKSYSPERIDTFLFKKISEIFFDTTEVPLEVSQEVLRNLFTDVTLPEYKKNFLNCWKYIYTINVDDAIERNTNFFAILPYSNLRIESENIVKKNRYVLKLHGDAHHEILCNKDHNMVFSSDQYISSLLHKSNSQLIKSIYSDYKQKNILFIGCSLEDEPDLRYIYENSKGDITKSYIMQVRSQIPEKEAEKDISKHGVNTIILVDSYDSFYKELYTEFNKKTSNAIAKGYRFKNPLTNILSDRKNILDGISRGSNPFNVKTGYFCIPAIGIDRYIAKDRILKEIDLNNFLVIQGRRFSGKTYILNEIAQKTPRYDKYFFPSNVSVDEDVVDSLLKNSKESIFLFDSNSVTTEIYNVILSRKKIIVENKNKVVIASNTNEDFLISKLKAQHYYVKSSFESGELQNFNAQADKLAFAKRKLSETNLEYSFRLLKQNNMEIEYIPTDISAFSQNEQTIIFMLSVFDKVYIHEVYSLDISQKDIAALIGQYPILFEEVDCDPEEAHGKSVRKIVHNSRSILLQLIKKMPNVNVLAAIKSVISGLYIYDRQQYKAAMMFDTLNQLFSQDGAGYLIEYIYSNLEDELYSEPHFWLQRAKSIYRLFKNEKDRLLTAVTYANKVIEDSVEGSNLQLKAKFSSSLIYCMLYKLESDISLKIGYQIESIKAAHYAFFPGGNYLIPSSVHADIFTYKAHGALAYDSIVSMCSDFISPENKSLNPVVVNLSIDIIHKLHELKSIYDEKQLKSYRKN